MIPHNSDPKLPLIIGIAGHRYLPENASAIENRITQVFRAFSATKLKEAGEDAEQIRLLRQQIGFPSGPAKGHEKRETVSVENGLPESTPVWIMSPAAQGADILAIMKAEEVYKSENRQCRFIAPLPTPWSIRIKDDDGEEDAEDRDSSGPKEDVIHRTWNAKTEEFKRLRGSSVLKEATEAKLSKFWDEFILPLNGRGILQNNTTFPKSAEAVTANPPPPVLGRSAFLEWAESGNSEEIRDAIQGLYGGEHTSGERAHFRALAHYVALYSHVLIAVWDGEMRINSVGTDAAVRAKIAGPSGSQISETGLYNWADAGPVIQILSTNKRPTEAAHDQPFEPEKEKRTDVLRLNEPAPRQFLADESGIFQEITDKGGGATPSIGDSIVIHPDDCSSDDTEWEAHFPDDVNASDEEKEIAVKSAKGRKLFGHILASANLLNTEDLSETGLDEYYSLEISEDESFDTKNEDRKLRQIYEKAAKISQKSVNLKEETLKRFSLLFLVVTLAAVTFDVYAHWYADHDYSHYSIGIFFFVALVGVSIWIFWRHLLAERIESRYLEMRALAEATRIQLAWMTAGIPQSVALHYLQRHRSGFDYIRDTVSAWCFPYESAQRKFDRLKPAEKLRRLEFVREKWIGDQAKFFKKKGGTERVNQHRQHVFGIATALVGVCSTVVLLGRWLSFVHLSTSVPALAVLIAGFICSGFAISKFWPGDHGHHAISPIPDKKRYLWILFALLCFAVFGVLLPGNKYFTPEWPGMPVETFVYWTIIGLAVLTAVCFLGLRFCNCAKKIEKELVLPLLPLAFCAVCFVILTLSATFNSKVIGVTSPSKTYTAEKAESYVHHDFLYEGKSSEATAPNKPKTADGPPKFPWILMIGLPLLLGALLVAWGEKQLFAEHANRYESANELFRLTNQRVEKLLKEAGEIELSANGETILNTDEEEKFYSLVATTQTALYQLGKEALSENAEWLILHRTRPLEFPMAG